MQIRAQSRACREVCSVASCAGWGEAPIRHCETEEIPTGRTHVRGVTESAVLRTGFFGAKPLRMTGADGRDSRVTFRLSLRSHEPQRAFRGQPPVGRLLGRDE